MTAVRESDQGTEDAVTRGRRTQSPDDPSGQPGQAQDGSQSHGHPRRRPNPGTQGPVKAHVAAQRVIKVSEGCVAAASRGPGPGRALREWGSGQPVGVSHERG